MKEEEGERELSHPKVSTDAFESFFEKYVAYNKVLRTLRTKELAEQRHGVGHEEIPVQTIQ